MVTESATPQRWDERAVVIEPATPQRWADLEELFTRPGPRGGRPVTDGCWCMFWRQRSGDADVNREAIAGLVAADRRPGLLAYDGDRPVGWVSIGPREEFGQLLRSRAYRPTDEDEGVFSIVCFYVDPPAKHRGVATRLLDAALEHAAARGAAIVEAYPKDPPDYMGSLAMFERAGFRPVRQAGPRTVMRHHPAQR